jgi:hypothetical protein
MEPLAFLWQLVDINLHVAWIKQQFCVICIAGAGGETDYRESL